MINDGLQFSIHCQCGGVLRFKVNSVNYDKQYICPDCSNNLTNEVAPFLVNVKDSLNQHCSNCQPLEKVRNISLSGRVV